MFVVVSRERWGVCLAWGASEWPCRCLSYGTGGRGKLCMVPCHRCHIYGNWRSKEVGCGGGGGGVLKPLFEVASHNRGDIGADNVLK